MIKRVREAEDIVGGLSQPSKMPGLAYGIPAKYCSIGSFLRDIKGSVCANCYALKGRYVFENVKKAQQRRFSSLTDPQWVDAMVFLMHAKKCEWFRWHDSGDIQGIWHLENICEIARRCPDTQFWLPTRETGIVKFFIKKGGVVPPNLCIRISANLVDEPPPMGHAVTSTVVSDRTKASCPSQHQHGKCGDCRACWNPEVANVSYAEH